MIITEVLYSIVYLHLPILVNMLLFICRYFCTVVGFAIIILMLYKAFTNIDGFHPINAIEYSVPALVFIGIAYKSFPKENRERTDSKKRQLNS